MANLVNVSGQNVTDNPHGVAISTSIDGGQHFTRSYLANELGCGDDEVDQETLTADTVVPNQYFLTWRYKAPLAANSGACGISFTVNATVGGTVAFASTPKSVPVQDQFNEGVGGILIQEAGDTITLVNADTDVPGANGNNCDGPITMGWRSLTSIDCGQTWPISGFIASHGSVPHLYSGCGHWRHPNGLSSVRFPRNLEIRCSLQSLPTTTSASMSSPARPWERPGSFSRRSRSDWRLLLLPCACLG